MRPINIKQLQRDSRHLLAQLVAEGQLIVSSKRDPRTFYTIQFEFVDEDTVYAACNCPWGQHHGIGCSHVMAAMEYLASLKDRTLSFWLSEDEAQRQNRKTFFLTTPDDPDEGLWITSRGA